MIAQNRAFSPRLKNGAPVTRRPIELYLVEMEAPGGSERFHKVGVSQNLDWRFSYGVTQLPSGTQPSEIYELRVAILADRGLKPHPYKAKVLCAISFQDECAALLAERELLEVVAPAKYTPTIWFSGQTECFQTTDEIVEDLVSYIQGLPT
jgi:hypothetical protein